VQVQRRERRRGRLSTVERYTEDLRRAIVRGGYDEQILVGGNRRLGWYDGEGRDGGRVQGRGVEEGLAAVEYAQCTVVRTCEEVATLRQSGRACVKRKKDQRNERGANPGTAHDIDETHSSCGSAANLAGGMMLSMYSISSVSSCLTAVIYTSQYHAS
jgi:hypothetical protein